MTLLIYFLIVGLTALQSASTKLFSKTNDNSAGFNLVKTTGAFLLFAIIGLFGGINFNLDAMLYGSLYGFMLCISTYCGYMALATGTMSLTSMLVSFSVLIPIVYGIVFLHESLNLLNTFGLVLLFMSSILLNINKGNSSDKFSKKWFFYIGMTFLCNGFCSVIQKLYQINCRPTYSFEFMLFATLICSIIFLIANLKSSSKKLTVKQSPYALIAGFSNGSVGYLTLKLAEYENASVLFPAISAGSILCALLLGRTLFKEKLKYNHIAAVIFGIAAIVLLKL